MNARAIRPPRPVGLLTLLLMLGLGLPVATSAANDADQQPRFRVLEASTRLVDEVYLLDARVAFDFTDDAIEALVQFTEEQGREPTGSIQPFLGIGPNDPCA